ncbi:unnamed protein product [Cylicocyclus nassatus]|uniref:Uncharacterized protein n=1 Tax=Cylicocyclus nassatus TaxID=53992 RepID=A0AA36HD97_CYLNA|nr:unnamed protein product [Cylicocyclus nassatus]
MLLKYLLVGSISVIGVPVVTAEFVYAVDVPETQVIVPMSEAVAKCLKMSRYSAVFLRAFPPMSTKYYDRTICNSIANAKKVGLHVDLYMSPLPSPLALNATGVIDTFLRVLDACQETANRVWLKVTNSLMWGVDRERSVAFINNITREGEAHGIDIGIYTNEKDWNTITNYTDTLDFEPKLLWYYNVRNNGIDGETSMNFQDFEEFGPFSNNIGQGKQLVKVKQFGYSVSVCGMSVGRDTFEKGSLENKVSAPVASESQCCFGAYMLKLLQLFFLIYALELSIQKHVSDDEVILDFPLQSPQEEVVSFNEGLNRPSITNISQSCQGKGDTVACFFADSVKRISETLDFYYKKLREIFGWGGPGEQQGANANNSTGAVKNREILKLDEGLLEIEPGHQKLRLETETMHRRRKMDDDVKPGPPGFVALFTIPPPAKSPMVKKVHFQYPEKVVLEQRNDEDFCCRVTYKAASGVVIVLEGLYLLYYILLLVFAIVNHRQAWSVVILSVNLFLLILQVFIAAVGVWKEKPQLLQSHLIFLCLTLIWDLIMTTAFFILAVYPSAKENKLINYRGAEFNGPGFSVS